MSDKTTRTVSTPELIVFAICLVTDKIDVLEAASVFWVCLSTALTIVLVAESTTEYPCKNVFIVLLDKAMFLITFLMLETTAVLVTDRALLASRKRLVVDVDAKLSKTALLMLNAEELVLEKDKALANALRIKDELVLEEVFVVFTEMLYKNDEVLVLGIAW
jgi:general stress protein CsbA